MMPSCDQTGVPIHFHSSTTSGSASLMSLRILLRVSPRQSPSSAILFEMSSDADWLWLAPDFFMFSSSKFRIYFICKLVVKDNASFFLCACAVSCILDPSIATHLDFFGVIYDSVWAMVVLTGSDMDKVQENAEETVADEVTCL